MQGNLLDLDNCTAITNSAMNWPLIRAIGSFARRGDFIIEAEE